MGPKDFSKLVSTSAQAAAHGQRSHPVRAIATYETATEMR